MNDSLKYEKEILEIKSVIQEEIELSFYTKRNTINQYVVTKLDKEQLSENCVILISLDKRGPEAVWRGRVPSQGTVPEEFPTYLGKLEIFKCTKKSGLFNKEKLEVEKSYKESYSKDEWIKAYKGISLRYILEL